MANKLKTHCLVAKPTWLPGKIKPKLELMAQAYRRNGYIEYPFSISAYNNQEENQPTMAVA